jgi:hypothetical protein
MSGAPVGTFKRIRVGILLGVLLIVAYQTWHDHWATTRWRVPLYVAIYPIAADDSPATAAYVDHLEPGRFADIDRFFAREAQRYHLALDTPVKTRLRARLDEMPPHRDPDAGALATALFTLELRYWALRHGSHVADPEDIRLFVLYHDPERTAVVPHSLGLAKGLIGVVYAFATPLMDGANNVVIAHELLHTLGATDKYDFATDAPRFPDGYGEPAQQPLYPQRYAELMAGRRVLDAHHWVQTASLEEVLIGTASAAEIRWPSAPDPPDARDPPDAPDAPDAPRAPEAPVAPGPPNPPQTPRAPRGPELRAQLSASSTAACRDRFAAASTERVPSPIGAPARSVKWPPASVTMATQAAMSRMLMSVSTTTSRCPAASRW